MLSSDFGLSHHYYIADKQRVIYCAPPKDACSLVKFISICSQRPEYEGLLLANPSFTHRYSHLALLKQRQDLDAFRRVALVRDPFVRTISAFMSKFILFENADVLAGILDLLELKAEDVTFRIFLNMLCDIPDVWLDPHFRSQYDFLAGAVAEYRIVEVDSEAFAALFAAEHGGRFMAFRAALRHEEDRLYGPRTNANPADGAFVDTSVKKLRYLRQNGLDILKCNFFDRDLRSKCHARYAADVALVDLARSAPAGRQL